MGPSGWGTGREINCKAKEITEQSKNDYGFFWNSPGASIC